MKITIRDNLGRDVTHEREWYINTDGQIFYYTGDIDDPLYIVDNDYTFEVDQSREYYIEPLVANIPNEEDYDWIKKILEERPPQAVEVSCPSCCDGCSNHPKNGGSGICNCTLPYMQNPTNYTVQSGDYVMTNSTGGYIYTTSIKLPDASTSTVNIAEAVERIKKYLKE